MRRCVTAVVVAIVTLAWLAGAGSALGRELRVQVRVPRSVQANAAPFTVKVRTRRGAVCSLTVRARRSTLHGARVKANRRGRVEWSWLVPAKAPSGRWHVRVTCARRGARGHGSRTVRVRTASRNRFGPMLQHSTGKVLAGERVAKGRRRGRSAEVDAQTSRSNPFPWGECTWWASGKRPDLFPRVHGNAGDWLSEAQRAGIPTGSTPAVGAIAVFFPYTGGAGGYGHVAYVESVNRDGTITISEYNWIGYHRGPDFRRISPRIVSGFIYGGPVGVPPYHPVPAGGGTAYNVYGTGTDGLYEHVAPTATSRRVGLLRNGTQVVIVCQTQTSSAVRGSTIWDKLSNGTYVSDYFVDTPGVGSFTLSIPRCNVPVPPPPSGGPPGSHQYHIYHAPGGVNLRNGPSTQNAVVGSAPNGAAVTIVCQTRSGSYVNNSDVWDLLTNNTWVSDYYVDTPAVGNYSPGLSHCSAPQRPRWVAPAGSQPQTHHVHGTGSDGLFEREEPGTQYPHDGWLPEGATIMISCQTKSSSAVNGSTVWDLLTDGNFVSDYYVDTPVYGDYSPGIAHCLERS